MQRMQQASASAAPTPTPKASDYRARPSARQQCAQHSNLRVLRSTTDTGAKVQRMQHSSQ